MVNHGGKDFQSAQTNADRIAQSARAGMFAKTRKADGGNPETDRFFEAGYQAALQAGCEFLFEVPPILLERNADRAAAIRCDGDGGSELFFLVFDAKRRTMIILEEDRVPETVLDFTLSYLGVLAMIAADGRVADRRVH